MIYTVISFLFSFVVIQQDPHTLHRSAMKKVNGGNRYRNQVLLIVICQSGLPRLRLDDGIHIISVTTQKGLICFKSDMLNKSIYFIWFSFKTVVVQWGWTECKICMAGLIILDFCRWGQFRFLCVISSFKPGYVTVTYDCCTTVYVPVILKH